MLYSTKKLDGLKLGARDGEIGKAREVYFDDQRWVIRHLVADTGGWLSGRKVLISPHSIERVDVAEGRLELNLTRSQIENAPDIDTDKPVSRQQQIPYYDYYGYPYYWAGPGLWGLGAYPMAVGAMAMRPREGDTGAPRELDEVAEAEREAADPHLRSSREVIGYDLKATDGDIGHVEDFLFDDRTWQIRYVVVDTRDWLPGKRVLVSPDWVDSVDWSGRVAHFKVSREAVKASPEYQPDRGLSEEEVQRVQRHYERSQ